MAYSDFTLNDIKQKFQITVDENTDLFSSVNAVPVSAWLTQTLDHTLNLALAIASEKARSELIIAPVLVELRNQARKQISLFSGINFPVDPALGLTGFCDFIVSRSPEQLVISAPVLIIVEAKNENINAGMPQCMAAMIAARIFNEREGQPISPLYGAVTTGNNWRFLMLEANTVYIDQAEYYISQVDKLLGILTAILGGTPTAADKQADAAQKAA
jgi:hypothetical protein